MVIGLIALSLGIVLMDLPVIVRSNKIKKTIVIYLTIFIISFVLSLLQALDKAPPSPSDIITKIVDSIIK